MASVGGWTYASGEIERKADRQTGQPGTKNKRRAVEIQGRRDAWTTNLPTQQEKLEIEQVKWRRLYLHLVAKQNEKKLNSSFISVCGERHSDEGVAREYQVPNVGEARGLVREIDGHEKTGGVDKEPFHPIKERKEGTPDVKPKPIPIRVWL